MTIRDRDSAGRTRSAKRKPCAFVLATILAVLVSGPSGSFLAAPMASAHTDLESSTPAEGDVVNDIVDEIELVFTEPVETVGEGFEVFLPNEEIIRVEPTTDDNITFVLDFDPPLGNGEVGVRFEVISADGHIVTGSFAFTIDDPTPESTDPDPIEPETDSTTTVAAPVATEPGAPTTSAPVTTPPAGTAPATTAPATTASVTTVPPTTAAITTEPGEEPELVTAAETTAPTGDDVDEDGSSTAIIVVIAILAALAAAIGGVIYARKRSSAPPSEASAASAPQSNLSTPESDL